MESVNKSAPIDLGLDVLFYDGDDPDVLTILSPRRRFLDILWLPCALAELSADQIAITSRFREGRIGQDLQFQHAKRARQAVISLIRTMDISKVLEVGCGKFPIVRDIELALYRAIEIDSIAIEHCRKNQLDVGLLEHLSSARDDQKFDLIAALYAFHFSISDELVRYLEEHLSPSGFLIFNFIADDTANALRTLALLSTKFSFCRLVKTVSLSPREFFVIMARSKCFAVADMATALLLKLLSAGGRR